MKIAINFEVVLSSVKTFLQSIPEKAQVFKQEIVDSVRSNKILRFSCKITETIIGFITAVISFLLSAVLSEEQMKDFKKVVRFLGVVCIGAGLWISVSNLSDMFAGETGAFWSVIGGLLLMGVPKFLIEKVRFIKIKTPLQKDIGENKENETVEVLTEENTSVFEQFQNNMEFINRVNAVCEEFKSRK